MDFLLRFVRKRHCHTRPHSHETLVLADDHCKVGGAALAQVCSGLGMTAALGKCPEKGGGFGVQNDEYFGLSALCYL